MEHKAQFHVQNTLELDLILSQMNPVHAFKTYVLNLY